MCKVSEAFLAHTLRVAEICETHGMSDRAAEWRAAHDTLEELNHSASEGREARTMTQPV